MHIHPVSFKVHLVHDIETIFGRKFKQKRVRRIMGRPYGVNVEPLAQLHISLYLQRGHRIAVGWAGIVMVHALELHGPSIHEEHSSLYTDILESNHLVHT